MAEIRFLGAAGTVTGSRHLVTSGNGRVLVDCGLFQGRKELRRRNWEPLDIDPRSIDAVVLTHAHIDHSGYLPRLFKDGFRGEVFATEASADLLYLLLTDAGHLQEEEASFHRKRGTSKHKPALPLYTAVEGREAARHVRGLRYETKTEIAPGFSLRLRRAGHILGSASALLQISAGRGTTRILFSGDVGRYGAPILPDPQPACAADFVVVESTYGDRKHDPRPVQEQLEKIVLRAAEQKGAIIVPAFAVGRTQELMFHLSHLEQDGRIPSLPAFVDSPMAVNATEIYCRHPEEFEGDMRDMVMDRNCPLHCADFQLARTASESRRINSLRGPLIIVAASGMLNGGRVLHHLRQRVGDARTTVLFVGFQAVGTRGRQLQEGAKSIRVFGANVPVRAQIETVHGLSAHADADGLMTWLATVPEAPRRLFVVHGEPGPARALAERAQRELGWKASVPEYSETFALEDEGGVA